MELQQFGLLEWSIHQNSLGILDGYAELATFKAAFEILSGCLPIDGACFSTHSWSQKWDLFGSDSYDSTTFTAMNKTLIDDCIRKIATYLDYLHLIQLSRIDKNFKAIAAETLARCHVRPSAIGTIDIMNFRYLLDMFGSSMYELSVSLDAFISNFGTYFPNRKSIILQVILCRTNMLKLKKVILYRFDLSTAQKNHFVKAFSDQRIELIEIASE